MCLCRLTLLFGLHRVLRTGRAPLQVRREQELNANEVENANGREVRYGKVVQLQHVASGLFVVVSHQASERNRDARKVLVSSSDAFDASWFRIMPKLRVHTEGDKCAAHTRAQAHGLGRSRGVHARERNRVQPCEHACSQ